jgi:hypothetical protein
MTCQWRVDGAELIGVIAGNRFVSISLASVLHSVEEVGGKIANSNMHHIGLMLERRSARIKELEVEIARLQRGKRPASDVRDLVLSALKNIAAELNAGDTGGAGRSLAALIQSLGSSIPGEVEYRPRAAAKAESPGVKEYVPLKYEKMDEGSGA